MAMSVSKRHRFTTPPYRELKRLQAQQLGPEYRPTSRPTIKVKLPAVGKNPQSAEANETVKLWTKNRECGPTLIKAIVIMERLRNGDPTALLDEFPWLAGMMGSGSTPARPARPSLAETLAPPEIIEDTDDDTLFANGASQAAAFLGDFDL